MGWIVWLIAGVLSGASITSITRNRLGLLGDMLIGVLGAMLGGLLSVSIGAPSSMSLITWSVSVSFVSGFGLLVVLHTLGGTWRIAPPTVAEPPRRQSPRLRTGYSAREALGE